MTNSIKLRAYGSTPPDDIQERRGYYNNLAKKENDMDVLEFRNEIDLGRKNIKCLDCYLMGLRYCIYWNDETLCNEYERKEVVNAFMEFK